MTFFIPIWLIKSIALVIILCGGLIAAYVLSKSRNTYAANQRHLNLVVILIGYVLSIWVLDIIIHIA